jgi:anti-sigma regulatory factor (Ser/Thr protein kinase)
MTKAEHAPPAAVAGALPGARPAARREARPLTLRIPRSAEGIHRARHWFRDCLRNGHDDGAGEAESIFAEVATNAFVHSHGQIMVTVRLSHRAVRCDVRDRSWRRPGRARPRDPESEEGRGMMIITALADNWGVQRHLRGKTIWFEVHAPARAGRGVPAQ